MIREESEEQPTVKRNKWIVLVPVLAFLWGCLGDHEAEFERAIASGDVAAVSEFLRDGESANAKTRDGRSMIELALRNNHPGVVEVLLAAGADPDTKIGGGDLLHIEAASGSRCSASLLRELVELKGSPNVSDEAGLTPLHLALEFGANSCAQALLDLGADPQATSIAGTTMLHSVARGSTASLAESLVNAAVPIDARDATGLTALHIAAGGDPQDKERDAVIGVLLDHGAGACATTPAGRAPADIAYERGALERAELLRRRCKE